MRVDPHAQQVFDPSLQEAFRRHETFRQVDVNPADTPVRPQKWGDRNTLKNDTSSAAGSPQPEENFVDVGPFPTPIALRLDYDIELPAQTTYPTWIYRLVIGMGTTSIIREFDELPRIVVAQSLQVYVRRRQSILFNGPQFPMTLWATPAPVSVHPTPIGFQAVTMGIGTATAPLNPPRFATHVMAPPLGGETQTLFLQVSAPVGVASGAAFPLGFTPGAGSQPNMWVVPIPPDMLTYELRRVTTTAALNYTVFYLRC